MAYNSPDQTSTRNYAPQDASPSISFGKNALGPSSANYAPGGDGNTGYGGSDQNNEEESKYSKIFKLIKSLKNRYDCDMVHHSLDVVQHALEELKD